MISREEALKLVQEKVKNEKLIKHMLAVEAIMRKLAERLGEDPELWSRVGLLHDLDYEEVGEDMSRHGLVSAEMVKDLLPEEGLHAIRAHNEMTGVEAESPMDYALIAADAISGLAIATALMMPHRTLAEVRVKSLRKKFKDKSFARNVDRDKIRYCTKLGLTLEDFFALSLEALQSVREELGL